MYTPKNETDFTAAYARGERDFNLSGYAHPLPASLTTTGDLDLRGYAHPLPASLTTTGYLYLSGYAHPLPAGLRRGKNNLRPTDD